MTIEKLGIFFIRLDRDLSRKVDEPRHLHPALDIKYIIANIENEFKTFFHDQWLDNLSEDKLIDKVLDTKCNIVVIRATSFCFEESISLASRLSSKNLITIAIGQQSSHLLKISFEKVKSTYSFVLHGEVEQALPELIKNIHQEDLHELRENYKKAYLSNFQNIVENPDSLPKLKFSKVEQKKYPFPFPVRGGVFTSWGYILTAWGCPHKCEYCSLIVRKSTGDNLRRRSPKHVVEEIEAMLNEGVEFIVFEDDTLFCNRQHLQDICNLIIEKKLSFSWMCNARIDEIYEDTLSLAKRAGLKLVKIGLESGSPKIIESLGKHKDGKIWMQLIEKNLQLFEKYQVGVIGLFMVGIKNENDEDFELTRKLIKRINVDYIQVQIFTPYPDIKYYKEIEEKIDSQKSLYHYKTPSVKISDCKKYDEPQMQNILYNEFYYNLGFILRHLKLSWRYYIKPSFLIRISNILSRKIKKIVMNNLNEI